MSGSTSTAWTTPLTLRENFWLMIGFLVWCQVGCNVISIWLNPNCAIISREHFAARDCSTCSPRARCRHDVDRPIGTLAPAQCHAANLLSHQRQPLVTLSL